MALVFWQSSDKGEDPIVKGALARCSARLVDTPSGNALTLELIIRNAENRTTTTFSLLDTVFYTKDGMKPDLQQKGFTNPVRVQYSNKLPREFCEFFIYLFKTDANLTNSPKYARLREAAERLRNRLVWSQKEIAIPEVWNTSELNVGNALTDTEVEMLYFFWSNPPYRQKVKAFLSMHTTAELVIYSKLDVCDTCTYALLQSGLMRLFGLPHYQLEIYAATWRFCAQATLWGREYKQVGEQIKKLIIT